MSRTTLLRRFGHAGNRYTLEELTVTEKWTTHDGRTWLGRRQWVRPKTAADAAAWRRDGSPSRWCTGKTDTDPPVPICFRTAPGISSLTRLGHGTFELVEGRDMTFGQLQRLPGDARVLRSRFVRMARHDLDPSAGAAVVDLNVENELADLIINPPVPPAVRAAAFRALATMPHVTSTGPTHDELGRAGVGIRMRFGTKSIVAQDDGGPARLMTGPFSRTLIIDPATSHVLADELAGGDAANPFGETLILDSAWTNGRPHVPSFPRSAATAAARSAA
jgi:hypothetical protein